MVEPFHLKNTFPPSKILLILSIQSSAFYFIFTKNNGNHLHNPSYRTPLILKALEPSSLGMRLRS